MADLLTTLHPINDNNTDLYPNVKNENIPPVVSGKDAMEALEGDFSTLKTDEIQIGGENGTLINKDQIVTQNKVINLDEIVDDAELAQGLNGKVDKVQGKGLSTNDFTDADKSLVATIPYKVDKVNGKGLSTNDFTNEDKNTLEVAIPNRLSSLNTQILNLYRMVIRSGEMITVTDASVALASQPFPLTVSPKALLNYVGGMCKKVGDSIITAPVTMVVSKGNTNIYYPIHPDIQALDGYGWGINSECYNYIDFEGKKFVRAVGAYTITGNENWSVLPVNNSEACRALGKFMVQRTDLALPKPIKSFPLSSSVIPNITANKFSTVANSIMVSSNDAGENVMSSYGEYLYFQSSAFANKTDEQVKALLAGTQVFYELATPVETDISNLLVLSFPTYDIINVLPGGYLEFENENDIGVPYSVTYQSKPNAQATALTTAQPTISEVDSNDPTDSI